MRNSKGAVRLFGRRSWFTWMSIVLLSISTIGLSSCTPNAEEVNHEKKLSRIQKGILDWRFTYNDFNKVEKIEAYVDLITLFYVETNTYDRKGRLVERHTVYHPLSALKPDWRETFTYKRGKLVNGYYREMGDTDSIPHAYGFHEIVSDESGILEYEATGVWQDETYYRLKRSISAGGNVDFEETEYENTVGNRVKTLEMEFDDKQNPLYGINFYGPFEMFNTNKNNVTQAVHTESSLSTRIYKYTYEYVDGYPISKREDLYNDSDVLLGSQEELYFYK